MRRPRIFYVRRMYYRWHAVWLMWPHRSICLVVRFGYCYWCLSFPFFKRPAWL